MWGVPQEMSRVNIDALRDYLNKLISDGAEMMNVLGNVLHAQETISYSFFSSSLIYFPYIFQL